MAESNRAFNEATEEPSNAESAFEAESAGDIGEQAAGAEPEAVAKAPVKPRKKAKKKAKKKTAKKAGKTKTGKKKTVKKTASKRAQAG